MYKVSKWNSKKSIKVHIGRLWFGGSWDKEKHPAAFVIFNGKRKGWQFMSWQHPRWATWSIVPAVASQDSRDSAEMEG